jgi:hypothetical protein
MQSGVNGCFVADIKQVKFEENKYIRTYAKFNFIEGFFSSLII